MTTVYTFPCLYTKLGIATAPSSAPTVLVVDKDNNILVAALTAITAITNMPGSYFYSYSGADGLVCWALFHTSDATVDQQDLASYTPVRLYVAAANTTTMVADYARRTGDYSTLDAAGVWGYATRTLSSFGTLIADIWAYVTRTLTSAGSTLTATDVWTYVTRTLTQTPLQVVQSVVDNSQINVYKSTSFDITLNNLPDFTGWQKMWFTVKEDINLELPDTESIIQVQVSNPSGTSDGLLYINKQVATPTDGYLAIPSTTSVHIVVKASVTGNLPPKTLYYGIKYINAAGNVVALSDVGEFVIHHSTSKKVT